eukprot:1488056-Amphidinium_carterae.1
MFTQPLGMANTKAALQATCAARRKQATQAFDIASRSRCMPPSPEGQQQYLEMSLIGAVLPISLSQKRPHGSMLFFYIPSVRHCQHSCFDEGCWALVGRNARCWKRARSIGLNLSHVRTSLHESESKELRVKSFECEQEMLGRESWGHKSNKTQDQHSPLHLEREMDLVPTPDLHHFEPQGCSSN